MTPICPSIGIRKIFKASIVLVLIFPSAPALANATASQCYFDNVLGGPWNISNGDSTIQITNSTPIGSVLAARGISVRGVYTGKTGFPDIVRINGSWTSGGVGGNLDIYSTIPTNIPGIGLRWAYSSASTDNGVLQRSATPLVLAEEPAVVSSIGISSIQLQTRQELVLIGNTEGGKVTSTPGASANFSMDAVNSTGTVSRLCSAIGDFGDKYTVDLGPVQVQNVCEIETPSIRVTMGQFSTTDFPTINGPSTYGGTRFSIRLNNCTAAAKPSIHFIDVNNRANTSSLLNISSTIENGSFPAQGISIRLKLLANDQTVSFGSATNGYLMGPIIGNALEMPLQADYIRTGTVTPGHANATAEFFIDYP